MIVHKKFEYAMNRTFNNQNICKIPFGNFVTFGEFGAEEPMNCSAADVRERSRTKGGLVVPGFTEFDLVPKMGIPVPPGIELRDDAE